MRTIAIRRPERETARLSGDQTYFTGRPCKYGHVADRNTVDASCVECRRVFREGRRDQAAHYARQRRRQMLTVDPEGTRRRWCEYNRENRRRNPEKFRAWERKAGRVKRQKYPAAKLAETRKRQADKLQRTPAWADLKVIRNFYENCPIGYEVDHIIPLRGGTVSGLHVPENLQYLTSLQNKIKGNRYDG